MTDKSEIDLLDRPLAITDIETTGLNPDFHEIIEIGLVLVDQRTLRVIDTFESKVMPRHPERMSPQAQKLNGFDAAQWVGAPDLAAVLRSFAALTPKAMFTAWNVTFDWPFMRRAFEQTGVQHQMDYHRICLMSQAWMMLRYRGLTSMSQNSVAEFLGLPPEPAVHRAINGAWLSHSILQKLSTLG